MILYLLYLYYNTAFEKKQAMGIVSKKIFTLLQKMPLLIYVLHKTKSSNLTNTVSFVTKL